MHRAWRKLPGAANRAQRGQWQSITHRAGSRNVSESFLALAKVQSKQTSLGVNGWLHYIFGMEAATQTDRERRLELARKAFRDFYAQCFWSYREDLEITEEKIPFVIRGLREDGGRAGYLVAAELCR